MPLPINLLSLAKPAVPYQPFHWSACLSTCHLVSVTSSLDVCFQAMAIQGKSSHTVNEYIDRLEHSSGPTHLRLAQRYHAVPRAVARSLKM